MDKKNFQKFVEFLLAQNKVIAPSFDVEGKLHLGDLANAKDLYLGQKLPLDSWKWFLLPPQQKMFETNGAGLKETLPESKNQVFLGVSILDLQALTLLNLVFENDPYYQQIKKKTIVIGTSLAPEEHFYQYFKVFKEDKLEHLQFDIFLLQRAGNYLIYTGSEDGQRLLDEFGYTNYQHIEYAGPIREEGLDKQMVDIKNAMQNNHRQEVWDELGKRCMQCGKCTIACPVCFCFRIFDKENLSGGQRKRCWDSCFYNEFSQVAGATPEAPRHWVLNSTAQKIYFWYEHHFVRTPATFSVPGCVGCNRCSQTCPAGIDIRQTLKDILKKGEKGRKG